MDLRAYYKRIREVENAISAPFVLVISLDTPDGGKAGTKSEVARGVAAKLIAESRARLASGEEMDEFHSLQDDARREADAKMAASRMQVVVMPQIDVRPSRPTRGSKE
jgi:hypothetical protein